MPRPMDSEERENPPRSWANTGGRATRSSLMPTLFGVLLAETGLPFLPWGRPGAFIVTVAVYAMSVSVLLFTMEVIRLPDHVDTLIFAVAAASYLLIGYFTGGWSVVGLGALAAPMTLRLRNTACGLGIIAAFAIVMSFAAERPPDRSSSAAVNAFSGGEWSVDAAVHGTIKFAVLLALVGAFQLISSELRERTRRLAEEEGRAERAVADERSSIARELHDVVAHHVSVMTLHAEGASAMATGPAAEAMLQVASSGRDALGELRRVLGVLRHSSDPPETTPQPGLAELEALAEQTTAAGLSVTFRRIGTTRTLSAGVELCAYRVAQEAITNATRHSGADEIEITLAFEPDALRVIVTDEGSLEGKKTTSEGAGLGLVGMRERVELRGGTLDAGPRPEGGFVVEARIPVDAKAASVTA